MTSRPLPPQPLLLRHYTATTCSGDGCQALLRDLLAMHSALAPCTFDTVDFATCTGTVPDLESSPLPAAWQRFDCRNNRLAWRGLQADGFAQAVADAVRRYGPTRVATLLGTSTAGIYSTELAYRQRDAQTGALPADFHYAETHNTFSVADFVRHALGLQGPAAVISTACSSSAKAFASGARLLQAGLADAVVVGGVDSLCLTTLYGFRSLGLTSESPCKPFDAQRDGLSIGEAAAFALLERLPDDVASLPPDSIVLRGYGETSDAHHMSAPHPEGAGARAAMQGALQMAGLAPEDVDYINLHGTATPANDAAEGLAVHALFGAGTLCSSTKGFTGHTLGAAGAVEAVVCALALAQQFVPGSAGTQTLDPAIAVRYALQAQRLSASQRPLQPLRHVLNNSFGFGGSNCSLLFSRWQDCALSNEQEGRA
ncbi:MAG: beta-ketoacyl-[acyl-carrier-protein] synthase family protein [Brachymonas sp.]|nr:beta-ketoacyl-[acyl-carrier-protein] synthase family protein [Brachymonas sp.]